MDRTNLIGQTLHLRSPIGIQGSPEIQNVRLDKDGQTNKSAPAARFICLCPCAPQATHLQTRAFPGVALLGFVEDLPKDLRSIVPAFVIDDELPQSTVPIRLNIGVHGSVDKSGGH